MRVMAIVKSPHPHIFICFGGTTKYIRLLAQSHVYHSGHHGCGFRYGVQYVSRNILQITSSQVAGLSQALQGRVVIV